VNKPIWITREDSWHNQRDKKGIQNFGRKNLKEREHFKDVGINGKIILKRSVKKYRGFGLDLFDSG
jgi:hypothetical protein